MQVSPALPWTDETEGGTITLDTPVSMQDLVDGVLSFVINDGNGHEFVADPGEGNEGIKLVDPDSNIVYWIDRFEGSTTVLTIRKTTGAPIADYFLQSVEVTPQFDPAYIEGENGSTFTVTSNKELTVEEIEGHLQLGDGGTLKDAEQDGNELVWSWSRYSVRLNVYSGAKDEFEFRIVAESGQTGYAEFHYNVV